MSTSVAYLSKRLAAIGRHDLLEGAQRGEYSYLAAAEWAGLVTRRPPTGNGSSNAQKRRAWALMKVERSSQEGRSFSQEPRNGHAAPAMPDLQAAIAEWEQAQQEKEPEVALAATPPEPERVHFPIHTALPCSSCTSPWAAAAMCEVVNDYMAAVRGESHRTGDTLPRSCCQRQLRVVDVRALVG